MGASRMQGLVVLSMTPPQPRDPFEAWCAEHQYHPYDFLKARMVWDAAFLAGQQQGREQTLTVIRTELAAYSTLVERLEIAIREATG